MVDHNPSCKLEWVQACHGLERLLLHAVVWLWPMALHRPHLQPYPHLSQPYEGHTGGLCGNFCGDPSDGAEACITLEKKSKACRDDCGTTRLVCSGKRQIVSARRQCWLLQDPHQAFAFCYSKINPDPYVSSCVGDLCLTGDSNHILCLPLQMYATVCQSASITVRH